MIYSTLVKSIFQAVYGEPPEISTLDPRAGLVLVADGVGGLDLCGTALRYVMGSAKLPFQVRVVPWGHGFGRWHADLTNRDNRDAWGKQIADEVRAFREKSPESPVYLIGKSGGTGVIARALESLAETTTQIDGAVLIAPALSPRYDLSRALEAVRGEMVVFWSPFDVFVLGAGTGIFGTIDRIQGVSAGLVGFKIPENLNDLAKAQYKKLRQVRWRPGMASTGYLGGHVGPDSPAFLRKYVVPLLRPAEAPLV